MTANNSVIHPFFIAELLPMGVRLSRCCKRLFRKGAIPFRVCVVSVILNKGLDAFGVFANIRSKNAPDLILRYLSVFFVIFWLNARPMWFDVSSVISNSYGTPIFKQPLNWERFPTQSVDKFDFFVIPAEAGIQRCGANPSRLDFVTVPVLFYLNRQAC